jgi:phage FluMu gp28-like protein
MSSNPKRFRSKGGDVTLDEYDWHDKPREMYDAASPATTWGYDIAILTTRSAEGTHFDELVNLCKKVLSGMTTFDAENELEWSYHFVTIVKAIQQGLAEKIFKLKAISFEARYKLFKQCKARARDIDAFGREYMCIPSAEASTLVPYDMYQACVMENCLQELVPHTKECRFYYLGGDIGRHAHLTTFWISELVGDILVCRKIISLAKTPYHIQQQVLYDLLANNNIVRGCIDATGKGEMLVEEAQRKFGPYRIENLIYTNQLKDHLATQILNRFEDKRIRVPDDAKVRESFHKIKKTVTAAGHIRYDAVADDAGHSDEFWAAAGSVEAAATVVVPPQCIVFN